MRRKDREVSAEQAWEIVERCSYGVLAMTKPDGTPRAGEFCAGGELPVYSLRADR